MTRRTREIGIRIALGARGGDVLGIVLRDGLRPVLIGALVGGLASLIAARGMRSLLFGVPTVDPVAFLIAPALLLLAALVSASIPALRATRVDPLIALRED